MSGYNEKLIQAIQEFPAIAWLSNFTQVFDRGARNVYANCPFCGGQKTLALWREVKLFHCFKCDEGVRAREVWNGKANLIQMICILEKVSVRTAIEKIFKECGMPDPPRFKREDPKELLPEKCFPLSKASADHPAVLYLQKRKIEHLLDRAYITVGSKYDGRILFQTSYFGEVTGFEAKSYSNQKPKSIFPEWFDTYSTLYSTKVWRDDIDSLIITESLVDAETLACNTIGIFGSTLKDGQLSKLMDLARSKNVRELIWMLDGDAWDKEFKMILKKTLGIFDNSVVELPKDKDPNDLGFHEAWKRVYYRVRIRDECDLIALDLKRL